MEGSSQGWTYHRSIAGKVPQSCTSADMHTEGQECTSRCHCKQEALQHSVCACVCEKNVRSQTQMCIALLAYQVNHTRFARVTACSLPLRTPVAAAKMGTRLSGTAPRFTTQLRA